MADAADQAERTIAALREIIGREEAPVSVAASGGPDSTALAVLAARAAEQAGRHAPLLLHIDHGLRADSGEDAALVSLLADKLRCEAHASTLDPERLRADSAGLSAAARRMRYDALAELMHAAGSSLLLTGHTASDRLETFLINLIRGTGARGLGGPREDASIAGVRVHRPMLRWWKEDVAAFLEGLSNDLVPRPAEDPTNRDMDRLRARLRENVVPALLASDERARRGTLARSLHRIASDATAFRQLVDDAVERALVDLSPTEALLRRDALAAMSPAVRTSVVRGALDRMVQQGSAIGVDSGFIERVAAAVDEPTGREVGGHRGRVIIERDLIVLVGDSPAGEAQARDRYASLPHVLHVPPLGGGLRFETEQWSVRVETASRTEMPALTMDDSIGRPSEQAWTSRERFDAAGISPRLTLRPIAADDRLRPFGSKSPVGALDRMASDGHGRHERENALVLESESSILLVLGGRRAAAAPVAETTTEVVEVHCRRRARGSAR